MVRSLTNFLLHFWRHSTLDNLEGVLFPCDHVLAVVTNGKTALPQQFANLVRRAFGAIGCCRFHHFGGRRRRMLFILGRSQLGRTLQLGLGSLG